MPSSSPWHPEFERLLAGWGAEDPPIVLIQGSSVLHLYPDPSMRPLSDLDLLVLPEDLDRVVARLEKLGYPRITEHPPACAADGVVFDLHTDLLELSRFGAAPPLSLPARLFWGRKVRHPSLPVFLLHPDDNLIALCVHMQKHSFSQPRWFLDLIPHLDAHPPEGKTLWDRAIALSAEHPLYFAMRYLAERKNVRSARVLTDSAPPIRLKFLERRSLERLLSDRPQILPGELLFLAPLPPLTALRVLKRLAFPPGVPKTRRLFSALSLFRTLP